LLGRQPGRSSACEITPVPAPSSSTALPGAGQAFRTIRRHKAGEDGTMEPICNGLASHRRRNSQAPASGFESASK